MEREEIEIIEICFTGYALERKGIRSKLEGIRIDPSNRAPDVRASQALFAKCLLNNHVYSLHDTMLFGLLKTVIPALRKKKYS